MFAGIISALRGVLWCSCGSERLFVTVVGDVCCLKLLSAHSSRFTLTDHCELVFMHLVCCGMLCGV